MKASRFTSRFKRAETPAEPKADVAPAAATADAVAVPVVEMVAAPAEAAGDGKAADAVKVEATSAEAVIPPEPAPAASPPPPPPPKRASRLVEAVRPKPFANPIPISLLKEKLRAAKPAAIPAAAAAAIVLALGLGYGVGLNRSGGAGTATAQWMDTTATEIRQANGELARFGADQKALKLSLDGLKGEREKSRAEILSRQAALADKVEKAGQDQAARIARLAELVDRLEKTHRDPSRLQALTDRLERIEKSISSAPPALVAAAPTPTPTPPPKPVASAKEAAPPADVAQTGSITEAKVVKPEIDPRKTQIEGYFVRDFDSGFALVETRAGRYLDVAVGYTVPGVGRVEAIERRGRQWVVVTNKGFIGER